MKTFLLLYIFFLLPFTTAAQEICWAIKPIYEEIAPFSEGIAAVKQNGKWGYVAANGDEILSPAYEMAFSFSDGTGVLTGSGNQLKAIVTKTGNLITVDEELTVDSRFAAFSNGLLLVSKENKWGYLDKSGKIKIECRYKHAHPFSEELAAVCMEEPFWYYIQPDGKEGIKPDRKRQIRWASGFSDDKALVLFNSSTGYIDRTGRKLNVPLPKITAPQDEASYKQKIIVCKEGRLTFDSKSRVVAFITNANDTTRLMAEPQQQSANATFRDVMLDGETLVAGDKRIYRIDNALTIVRRTGDEGGRYGAIAFQNTSGSPVEIEIEDGVSVFGQPAALKCTLKNSSSVKYDQLKLTVNGQILPETIQIEPNGERTVMISPDKMKVTGELHLSISEYGLPMGEIRKNAVIRDIPSLQIAIAEESVKLKANQKTYNINVSVTNTASVPVKDVTVYVGDSAQKKTEDFTAGETRKFPFEIPVSTTQVVVTAQPPYTPPVSVKKKIKVSVEKSNPIPKPIPDPIRQ
ncbi:MAG: WG repeat-containing protein [Tannerella sp.]|jgi:hypothetical protein|nr:WG repeat-containing protein [Tannerella sp.]